MIHTYIVVHRAPARLDTYLIVTDFDLKQAVIDINYQGENPDYWRGEKIIAEMLEIDFDLTEPGAVLLINELELSDAHLITNHQFNLIRNTGE